MKDHSERYKELERLVQERTAALEETNTRLRIEITRRKLIAEELRERSRLATVSADVGFALATSTQLQDALQRCGEALVYHLEAAFVRIWLLGKERKVLELQASAGLYTHLNGPHCRVPMGESKIGRIARDLQPYLSHTVIGDPAIHDQGWARREGIVAFAGYPLIMEDRVVGVLAAFTRQPLSTARLEALTSVTDTIAAGIGRKQAETALQQSEEYFRSLIEHASDIVAILNSDGTVRYISPAVERALGFPPQDVIGRSIFSVVHQDDMLGLIRAFNHIVQNPGMTGSLEFQCQRADHSWCTLEGTGRSLLDNPSVAGVVVHIRDVTERRQIQDNIQRAKREWEATFDAVSDFILLVDGAGTILRCNRAIRQALHFPYQRLIGQPLWEVFSQPADPAAAVLRSLLSRQTLPEGRTGEGQFVWSDRWFTVRCHPVRTLEGGLLQRFVYILTDITGRKQAEEERQQLQTQLFQAQKLDAVGTLASGIAHDFNNILLSIQGFAELTTDEVSEESIARHNLDAILAACRHATALVKQLLAFSREESKEHILIEFHSLLEDILTFLRPVLPATITLVYRDTASGRVRVDPAAMQQMLLNLSINAAHAIGERTGQIELSLQRVEVEGHLTQAPHNLIPGPYLQLSVHDTGCGMTPDVMKRIFEPFFTTKPVGEGTGLGLAVVHGIVTNHAGTITIDSQVGKGTTFHIYLPLVGNVGLSDNVFPQLPAHETPHPQHEKGTLTNGTDSYC